MLSGATFSAAAMVGTAVFRIVVSSDSMKNATATSHGNSRLLVSPASTKATVADNVAHALLRAASPLLATHGSRVGATFYESRRRANVHHRRRICHALRNAHPRHH